MKALFWVLVLLFVCTATYSQSIVGLWEIKKVSVGDQEMTPKGKWINIHSDLFFDTGNGWTKTSEGKIHFSGDSTVIKPIAFSGLADPFGYFDFNVKDSLMTWEREEEGMMVEVDLQKIERLPMIDADKILGAWQGLEEGKQYVFHFRPDGRVFEYKNGGRSGGYYYIHPHLPQITIISDDRQEDNVRYELSFDNDSLNLKAIGNEREKDLVLKSVSTLPE